MSKKPFTDIVIRKLLDDQSLKFSEKAIRMIIKASHSLCAAHRVVTISEGRRRLSEIKIKANELSSKLREWYPYLEVNTENSFLMMLEQLANKCDESLHYYQSHKSVAGRTAVTLSLKIFIQTLILIYETETGEDYIIEKSTAYGRERTSYNAAAHAFIKNVMKHISPDEDVDELLKMARREPLPLEWAREVKISYDKTFREEKDRDKKRAEKLKKEALKKGYKFTPTILP